MGITASDVITLAQNTKALTKEQLAKILELAPRMTALELEHLKTMLDSVQKAQVQDMQNELATRKNVGAAFEEWKADTSRDALQTQEGASKNEEHAQAEALIQNI